MGGYPLTQLGFIPDIGLIITATGFTHKSIYIMTVPEKKFQTIFKSGFRSKIKCPCGLTISRDRTFYVCDPATGVIAALKQKQPK